MLSFSALYLLGRFTHKKLKMKSVLVIFITICTLTPLLAQKKHTIKAGMLYEDYSFYNYYTPSYGAGLGYNYQLAPRYSINTRLGWLKSTFQTNINGYQYLQDDQFDRSSTETTKFVELTLKYRLFPKFIPKNRIKLGVGATIMNLKYNYIEESSIKGIYLFYLRRNTIHFNSFLYHAMFEDQFQINKRLSIGANVVLRLTQRPLPEYHKHFKYFYPRGGVSDSFSTVSAYYTENFLFAFNVGYSF